MPPDFPPPAPIRTLCPGVVVSADTCAGAPRVAGTRIPTRTAQRRYARILSQEVGTPAHAAIDIAEDLGVDVRPALAFEAGRAWERERRAERKRRRLARRFRRGQQAAEGVVDDRG